MTSFDLFMLAYGLIALGLLLLVAELFIPSHGILFVLSFTSIVAGTALTFTGGPQLGLVTLAGLFVAVPVLIRTMLAYWPYTPIGRKMFLHAPDEDATIATMPVNLELEQLRGRFGRTLSALRPAGSTDFDGRRVDTISEGMLIEEGRWVRCVDVRGCRVVVREMDRPDLEQLETADWK